MIEKTIRNQKKNGILIKFPKKKQDLRADLPTIGYDTFKDCEKANLQGIVLKSKENIFLDQKKSINFANKNKIFIDVIWKKYFLTGRISDKLASKVVSKLKEINPNIKFLCVGGSNLEKLELDQYLIQRNYLYRFYQYIIKFFKIKKINFTIEEIIKFNPDILFL